MVIWMGKVRQWKGMMKLAGLLILRGVLLSFLRGTTGSLGSFTVDGGPIASFAGVNFQE